MNDMKLIMENWRDYSDSCKTREEIVARYLKDSEFLHEVMGIQVPLNESYPYSSVLTESLSKRIMQEQILLEGWFSDGWKKIKKLPGQVAGFMKSLWNVIKGGNLDLYWRGLKRAGLNTIQGNLQKVFKIVIDAKGKYPGSETMAEWAQTLSDKVNTAAKNLMGSVGISEELRLRQRDPPPAAIKIFGATVFLVGIKFLWDKLKEWAEPLLRTELGRSINLLKNIAAKFAKEAALKLATGLAALTSASLTGGASAIYAALLQVAEYAGKAISAAISILKPALAFYKRRGGLNPNRVGPGAPQPQPT